MKHGPLAVPRGTPASDRLRARCTVEPSTGCHLWQGATNAAGYGIARVDGKTVLVHRFLKAASLGRELADEEVCDHRCRTRRCANADHVRLVDHATNAIDNSLSEAARHAAKPVCPACSGEYTIESDGTRRCVPCSTAKMRAYNAANRAEIGRRKADYRAQHSEEINAGARRRYGTQGRGAR